MSLLITDPAFYAAAIPAVLLVGVSKSGFGAGLGALAVPLMATTIPVPQAAAIVLPLLCVSDLIGLKALWRQADRALLKLLLPGGLLGTAIGFASFGLLDTQLVAGLVGAVTLVFVALRTVLVARADVPTPPPWRGRLLATMSGFTSFVAHAGAPPMGFYLLPLKLPPMVFAGTVSVFFTIVNLAKWVPYAVLGLIDGRNMATSLVLMPLAPVGVWIGLRIARHISPTMFYRVFTLGLLATGLKLIWDALR